MKALCICQGGNSRSVACAYLLKYHCGVDALSSSVEKNAPETFSMLFAWADIIITMQPEFGANVPVEYQEKVYCCDVGPDVWFNGLNPELINLCLEKMRPLIANYPDREGDLK